MFVSKFLISLPVIPKSQKMRCLFRNRNIFEFLLNSFIWSIFLGYFELPMKYQHLKSCVFVQKDKTAFLSGKTPPDNIVESVVSQKSVSKFFLIVQPDLLFKSQNSHFLPFELHELYFYRLWTHFHLVSLSQYLEGIIGKRIVRNRLISSHQNQIRKTQTSTCDPCTVLNPFRRFVLIILHKKAYIPFSSNTYYYVFLLQLAITQ